MKFFEKYEENFLRCGVKTSAGGLTEILSSELGEGGYVYIFIDDVERIVQLCCQRLLKSVEDKAKCGENFAEDRRYLRLAQEDAQSQVPFSYLIPSDRLKKCQ